MAILLYNFLLSEIYEEGPVWDAHMNRFAHVVRYTDVINLFGMTRTIGYVTGVENYATTLNVLARDGLRATLVGIPITEREARGVGADGLVRNMHDVEIRFPATFVAGTPAVGTTAAVAPSWRSEFNNGQILTTKAELGLGAEFADNYTGSLNLLGRKIIMFSHLNRNITTAVPSAIVVGEKFNVTENAHTAAFETGSWGRTLRQLSLHDGDALISFIQRDFDNFPLYTVATGSGQFVRATRGELDFLADLIITAGTANIKNFRLYYVDNGTDAEGEDEFFYVYYPLSVAFAHAETGTGTRAGRLRLGNNVGNDNNVFSGFPHRSVDPGNGEIQNGYVLRNGRAAPLTQLSPAAGRAYMATSFGAERSDVTIYRELDVLVRDQTITRRGGRRLDFGALPITLPDNNNRVALGASNNIDMAVLGARVTVFGDLSAVEGVASRPYLIRQTGAPPTVNQQYRDYGIVIGGNIAVGASDMLVGTRWVRRVQIFDANAGRTRVVNLVNTDRTQETGINPVGVAPTLNNRDLLALLEIDEGGNIFYEYEIIPSSDAGDASGLFGAEALENERFWSVTETTAAAIVPPEVPVPARTGVNNTAEWMVSNARTSIRLIDWDEAWDDLDVNARASLGADPQTIYVAVGNDINNPRKFSSIGDLMAAIVGTPNNLTITVVSDAEDLGRARIVYFNVTDGRDRH
jgi:hypothetical protein